MIRAREQKLSNWIPNVRPERRHRKESVRAGINNKGYLARKAPKTYNFRTSFGHISQSELRGLIEHRLLDLS